MTVSVHPSNSGHRSSLLTREGKIWLFVVVAVQFTGWLKGINLILLLGNLLLAMWIVNIALAWWQLRRLTGDRVEAVSYFAGKVGAWEVDIENLGRHTAYGVTFIDSGVGHRIVSGIGKLEPFQVVRRRCEASFSKRGRYDLAPLRLECRFPFGLARIGKNLSDARERIVFPRIGKLKPGRFGRWLAHSALGEGRSRRSNRPSMVHPDDLHGLRPFRPGDSPRWIHWRTSARKNDLMVREFEDTTNDDLIIVVEPWIPGSGGQVAIRELEDIISLTATIADEWCHYPDRRLVVAIAGRKPIVHAGQATRGLARKILTSLAILDGSPSNDTDEFFRLIRKSTLPEAPVLFLSTVRTSSLRQTLARLGRPIAVPDATSLQSFYETPLHDPGEIRGTS
jgi:uncharacterized protein (DUF58 family)